MTPTSAKSLSHPLVPSLPAIHQASEVSNLSSATPRISNTAQVENVPFAFQEDRVMRKSFAANTRNHRF